MENPFEIIIERLENIEKLLNKLCNKPIAEIKATNYEEIMNLNKVSEYLSFSKSSIYKLTMNKEIPFFKRSRKLFFRRNEIDKWLEETRVKTTAELQANITQHVIDNIRRKNKYRK